MTPDREAARMMTPEREAAWRSAANEIERCVTEPLTDDELMHFALLAGMATAALEASDRQSSEVLRDMLHRVLLELRWRRGEVFDVEEEVARIRTVRKAFESAFGPRPNWEEMGPP